MGARSNGRRRRPSLLVLLGVLCISIGLVMVGLFVRDMFFDPLVDDTAVQQNVTSLEKQWADPSAAPVSPQQAIPASAIALMRIPDFGPDWVMPVVKGVTPAALHVGVGWFDETAPPGQIGNFAVAGHHGTKGIFRQLLDLKPGAVVLVETRDAIYEYHLTNTPAQSWVDHTETWVLDPVPGKPGTKPTEALITLITCKNLFRSDERTVAFGVLAKTTPKNH